MRYVIIRDDDTNAATPVECLEHLYRPFLDRGFPVNLAVIPEVATDAKMANGQPEGFLSFLARMNQRRWGTADAGNHRGQTREQGGATGVVASPVDVDSERDIPATLPIGSNLALVEYLKANSDLRVIQHGYRHDYLEFDTPSYADAANRLDRGAQRLKEAGFDQPATFVAPYDKLSRASFTAVAERFQVLSTGWFELKRMPIAWWPLYIRRKVRKAPHWQVGKTLLLSHPGCILSSQRNFSGMLETLLHHLRSSPLTVLVTHWWEYFPNCEPNEPFIRVLHGLAHYLATDPDLKVIAFSDLLRDHDILDLSCRCATDRN